MKKIILKGKTSEEKFKHIERFLSMFQRRLHKTMVGIIPPTMIPVNCRTPMEDGSILSYAVPASGELLRAVMVINKFQAQDGKMVKFSYGVTNDSGDFSKTFETKKRVFIADLKMDVKTGDVLNLKVLDPKNDDGSWKVEDIWVTFLFNIGIKDSVVKQQAFDQLELLVEGIDERI